MEEIRILTKKPLALIWLSCIEKPRTIAEINKIWYINDRRLYRTDKGERPFEILKKANLIEVKQIDEERKLYSKLNFLADNNWLDKDKLDYTFIESNHFFELNKEQKLRILNCDAFRKVCMAIEIMQKQDRDLYNLPNEKLIELDTISDWHKKIIIGLRLLITCKALETEFLKWDIKEVNENQDKNDLTSWWHNQCINCYNIIKNRGYIIPRELNHHEEIVISGLIQAFMTLYKLPFIKSFRKTKLWKKLEKQMDKKDETKKNIPRPK